MRRYSSFDCRDILADLIGSDMWIKIRDTSYDEPDEYYVQPVRVHTNGAILGRCVRADIIDRYNPDAFELYYYSNYGTDCSSEAVIADMLAGDWWDISTAVTIVSPEECLSTREIESILDSYKDIEFYEEEQ